MLLAFLLAVPCVPCHPKEVAGFARTGMAQSMDRPQESPRPTFTRASARFTITNTAGGMRHRPSSDIAHTSITDHRILRRAAPPTFERPRELTPWRDPRPAAAKRNRGLALAPVQ